jgi:carbon monoxide dehydrogenase subunit G
MIVSGEITIPAQRQTVFDALQNAPFFASCVEGVRDLKEIDATHYDAVLDTKVAFMKFSFKVSVEGRKISPPDRIEAKIEGTPIGVVGRFNAISTTDLSEAGDETLVKYLHRRQITGKLGSMGQPVLKSKAKEMEKGFRREDARGLRGRRWSRRMTPFELAEPTTLQEALQLLDPDDASVRPLGGGTALMLMMKAGVFAPSRLVSLRKIATLKRIAVGADGGLVIGALTPLSDVEHSAEVAKRAGVVRAHHAPAVQMWCEQSAPHRRAIRPRRIPMDSAPVLGVDAGIADGPREQRTFGRGAVCRILRDRAQARRTHHRAPHSGPGKTPRRLSQGDHRRGRRLAGARRRGFVRSRRQGGARRARGRQRRDREGDPPQGGRGSSLRRRHRTRRGADTRRGCCRGGRLHTGGIAEYKPLLAL